jgi:hypothetical protein
MVSTAVATPVYTASSYPFAMTGSSAKGSEAIVTEGGNVECNNHYGSSTINIPSGSQTVTFTPTFTGCSGFGFKEATVTPEGCAYVFHLTERVSAGVYRHHVDLSCPVGKSIKVSAGFCKMEIKGQTGLTTAKTTNSSGTLNLSWELQGIAYTVTQDGFACPFTGTGNKVGGSHTGAATISRAGGGTVEISGE